MFQLPGGGYLTYTENALGTPIPLWDFSPSSVGAGSIIDSQAYRLTLTTGGGGIYANLGVLDTFPFTMACVGGALDSLGRIATCDSTIGVGALFVSGGQVAQGIQFGTPTWNGTSFVGDASIDHPSTGVINISAPSGTTISGPLSAPSLQGTTTTAGPAAVALPFNTGNIPTLPANSGGFAGPSTMGGTPYLIFLPPTIAEGVLQVGAPTTIAGVNGAQATVTTLTSGNCVQAISGGLLGAGSPGACVTLGGADTTTNVALSTGAGTSPTGLTVSGTDVSHVIAFTTGSTPSASAAILTFTFTNSRGHASFCTVENILGSFASLAQVPFISSTGSATTYTLEAGSSALTASTGYSFPIICP